MNYLGLQNAFLGAGFSEHGYFSAEKFLVLAPVELARFGKTRAFDVIL